MRRPTLLLMLCVLSLVTGVALLRASAYVEPRPLPTAPASMLNTANIDLVSRFYDAVNTALRSGDQTDLDALVAVDLIEHPAQLGGPTGRAGLAQNVQALRTMVPGLQVIVDDLQATGTDQVTARVHVAGEAGARFLGLTLPPNMVAWPLLEEFRIEGQQIVERWRSEAVPVRLEPLFRAPVMAPSADSPFLQVVRVSHLPGSEVRLRPTSKHRLDYLETGILSFSAGAANEVPLSSAPVLAGQVLADHSWKFARSLGPEPASLLEVTMLAGPASGSGAMGEAQALVIAGGRITLAPGETLALPKLSNTTLVTVETGSLDLTTTTARIWVVRAGATRAMSSNQVWSMVVSPVALSGDPRTQAHDYQVVAAGHSVLVEPGAPAYWHNLGETPMVAMVMTLSPEADPVCLGSPVCHTLFR